MLFQHTTLIEPLQALILMHYISTFADCLVDVNQQSQLCQVFNQKQSTATIVFYMRLSTTRHSIYNSRCWSQSAKTINRIWQLAFCLMTYTIINVLLWCCRKTCASASFLFFCYFFFFFSSILFPHWQPSFFQSLVSLDTYISNISNAYVFW